MTVNLPTYLETILKALLTHYLATLMVKKGPEVKTTALFKIASN